jgi:lipopolysaccharide biosynthesis regulator YciM
MSDPKKPVDAAEGLDWDAALAEWDENTLVPEPARDKQTKKPGVLTGTPTPPPAGAKPLYRPMAAPPRVAVRDFDDDDGGDEESGATVIAAIPRELLRGAGRAEEGPKSAGGGLGQLFARDKREEPDPFNVQFDEQAGIALEEAPTLSRRESGVDEPEDPSVVTSAKAIGLPARPRKADAPALKRPSLVDATELGVAEGAMFDPFADPAPSGTARREDVRVDELARGSSDMKTAPPPPLARDTLSDPPDAGPRTAHLSPGPQLHAPRVRDFDPNDDTSVHVKGALHSPARREYDPNEETSILSKDQLPLSLGGRAPEPASDAPPPSVQVEDDPTAALRRKSETEPPKLTQTFDDERPAHDRLSEDARAAFQKRAEWLEAEARAQNDRETRARALLTVSELRAILGESEAAEMLAREASALSPQLAFAPRQARALSPAPQEAALRVDALDAEGRQSPTTASRLHGALLAADILRLSGDEEGAAKRWDQAARLAADDPRVALARAVRALARNDVRSPALRLPETQDLEPLARAVARVLKLRGASRADVTTTDFLPNDALARARARLDDGDVAGAAPVIAELGAVRELAEGAAWLASALGGVRSSTRRESLEWLRRVTGRTEAAAHHALAARGMELQDPAIVDEALRDARAFSVADRAVLADLMALGHASSEGDLDALAEDSEMRPLAAALAAVGIPNGRATRVVGAPSTRRRVTLARLLAEGAPASSIDEATHALDGEHDGESRAVALEMALRGARFDEVSDALAAWSDEDEAEGAARDRQLAAAVIADRAGDRARAAAAYEAAHGLDATHEAALRARLALGEGGDAVVALTAMARDLGAGARTAVAQLEAVARGGLDPTSQGELLEAAHQADPLIPVAAFLAERAARAAKSSDDVLHWVREQRAVANDPLEKALHAVREAQFVADAEPELARARLDEAHRAAPSDVALRELYERTAERADPAAVLADRGAWRERRAASAMGLSRGRLFTEAALEYERAGDKVAALRAASAANDSGDAGLGRLARERAELEGGAAARLADELLTRARTTEDARERREAYERLADLDATGRDDAASALLWHRSILEESPAALASLRYVEHALITGGRDEELQPIAAAIARTLSSRGDTAGETTAHAALSARLHMRGPAGEWEPTREMAELAAAQPSPALWALRAMDAHARAANDDDARIRTSLDLADRTSRTPEVATLMLRAGEAAMRKSDLEAARRLFDRAAQEDPGDVVTWGLLADVRQRVGDMRGAAEACESLARTSEVEEHQLLAWYDAGRMWLDDVGDVDRGVFALEQAAALDVGFHDVFPRLSALYTQRGARAEQAALLERRLEKITDAGERVMLEVERGRALVDVGDVQGARRALEGALAANPDHIAALSAYADMCAADRDWDAAERAWVRLARLSTGADEQRAVYAKLGQLYSAHLMNFARAEVAFKEVLKRAPDDVPTLERLVDVYRRQNDPARAVEAQQQLVRLAGSSDERRPRLLALGALYESGLRDMRKAEQALETARRESPQDVRALRTMAEFYQRQRQVPAVNVMLDRAAADARRALASGKLTPALFETMAAAFELRGRRDAARVVSATLAALEARPTALTGGAGRAADPRLDDMLAPEVLSSGLRSLLMRTGDSLDVASALDLRALAVSPLGVGAPQSRIAAIAASMGLPPVQVLVSPNLGRTSVPSSSAPPTLVVGESLLSVVGEPSGTFLVIRALKLIQAHASALVRTPPADLAMLVAAWLQIFNPQWGPQGATLADAKRRLAPGLPRALDPDLATIALEVAGALGGQVTTLGTSTMAWANRVALLAIGDPSAALDAVAWSHGVLDGAPRTPDARATWIGRTFEAKDLLIFSVSDAYAELRARLLLDR